MAQVLGLSPEIAAGAVISGAYFGDKMTPLSETTILVPQLVGGLTVYEHIRALIWTTGPAFLVALIGFALLGSRVDALESTADAREAALAALSATFHIGLGALVPIGAMVVLTVKRLPAFLSVFLAALIAGAIAPLIQPEAVTAFVNDPSLGPLSTALSAMFLAMATGFESHSGIEQIDTLFSRGGMASMLTTIWLILGALSFAAIMEYAGLLDRIVLPLIDRARRTGVLIGTVLLTAFGLNVIAGDQYVAIVLPARMFRMEFRKRGIAPHVLSRSVEDSGTVTSVLVPWNTCGAYMTGALGVSTFLYFPYCFFNLVNPLISLLYGFTGFRVDRLGPSDVQEPATVR
jgi:NhaC family Na+:H+ antiporter